MSLDAEDPRSGRTGARTGAITSEGQVLATCDVVAYAVGRVEGASPSTPAGAERGGLRCDRATTTSASPRTPTGATRSRAYRRAGLRDRRPGRRVPDGQRAGDARRRRSDPEPSRYRCAARGPSKAACWPRTGRARARSRSSRCTAYGARQTTTTDEQGNFRFDLVPEGGVELYADALASIDCTRGSLSVTGGETSSVTLVPARGRGARGHGGELGGSGRRPFVGDGHRTRLPGATSGASPWARTASSAFPSCSPGPVSAIVPHAGARRTAALRERAGLRTAGPDHHSRRCTSSPAAACRAPSSMPDGSPAVGAQVRIEASGGRYSVVPDGRRRRVSWPTASPPDPSRSA